MERKKGYIIENNAIVINRDLTELDLFVKDFLDISKIFRLFSRKWICKHFHWENKRNRRCGYYLSTNGKK
jgi:hypothetical protein